MNFGPKSFDIKSNDVYVIIETIPDIAFLHTNYKVIGVAHSLEIANKYSGPNRIIKGPVPLFDSMPNFHNPTPNPFKPNPFKPNIFLQPNQDILPPHIKIPPPFNPFGPSNPNYNFGLPQSPINPHNPFNLMHDNNDNDRMDLI